ncbi:MAG TPA: hypothetical protein VN622_04485 [Clostridia bacterium]|nr:hypothetical protein [Clostridia bacterium]
MANGSLGSDITSIAFRDAQRAAENLARVRQRVPAAVAQALVPLLSQSSNPDAALNLFERLTQVASNEVFRLMERHPSLVHYAVVVLANSQWLGETLIQNTDLFHTLARDRGLDRIRSSEEFRENFARVRSRSFETDISLLLARFKKREFVRIMLRDLLRLATLAETTAEISALADVLIDEALRECAAALKNRYGMPEHKDSEGRLAETPFTVLSMGKLGGNELNYSSDVDLLYLYGDGVEPATASISSREFFIRLAQDVTEVLSRVTREGSVFRIDLRLRPQGAEGEPAVSLGQALRYYGGVAHDWELQALLKVRHSAGDQALAREFIRTVQPLVYRSETETLDETGAATTGSASQPRTRLNFAAIETALDALQKMKTRRRKGITPRQSPDAIDVKLDRGGIRDIEFLVQCLQRVYGGSEPWLRSGGTLFSLQKLHDKDHISGKEYHLLTSSYEFLRKLEHRLQLRAGQQTHRLPSDEADLQAMWRSATGERNHISGEEVVRAVRARMDAVAAIYNRIIHQQQWRHEVSEAPTELRLAAPVQVAGPDQGHAEMLSRLAMDAPEVYELISRTTLSTFARRNLYRFLGSASTSSERYAAVIGSRNALERALAIFGTSQFLTDILVRHPEEIGSLEHLAITQLEQSETLFDTDEHADGQAHAVAAQINIPEQSSPAEAMALLRREYRHRVFLAGARDVLGRRSVWLSLEETTSAAEAAIRAALRFTDAPDGFAILALGRLGTREFDVLSDADLIFVRDEASDPVAGVRAAEALMQLLAAYTRDGSVFPVDARLRPHGAEGELVVSSSQLQQYFRQEAQAWEALTYTKLRFVSGDAAVADRALSAARELQLRFARHAEFGRELREMRDRLETSDGSPLNFKVSGGGMYDIEFIAAYLSVLASAQERQEPTPGIAGNMRTRLRHLRASQALAGDDAAALQSAADFLRALEHAVRLVDGRARKSLPVGEAALENVERLTSAILGRSFEAGVGAELRRIMREVRQRYNHILE